MSEYGTRPFYGGDLAPVETHASQGQKFLALSGFPNGVPLAPSNELSPASR